MSETNEASASVSPAHPARFGMPHAVVIVAFLGAAVVLTLIAHMTVTDVFLILAGAGAVSVVVLIATHRGGRRGSGGLLRRLLNAALTSGSGN